MSHAKLLNNKLKKIPFNVNIVEKTFSGSYSIYIYKKKKKKNEKNETFLSEYSALLVQNDVLGLGCAILYPQLKAIAGSMSHIS